MSYVGRFKPLNIFCVGFFGSGCKIGLPFSSTALSNSSNPSWFVTITLPGINAGSRSLFNDLFNAVKMEKHQSSMET